jgi:hypothetical protein
VQIGKAQTGRKRAVWIDAGIHAREWAAHHTAIYFIDRVGINVFQQNGFVQLLTEYSINPTIQHFLDTIDFYIVPVLNPDGYKFTWNGTGNSTVTQRMWRKNRNRLGGMRGEDCSIGLLTEFFPLWDSKRVPHLALEYPPDCIKSLEFRCRRES